ncbi:MAG: hypothetical protein H0V17_24245 [Deltaproteobacteria bacterium]|nr:hypothetical protein [Deltaproteobacteria bacterium]
MTLLRVLAFLVVLGVSTSAVADEKKKRDEISQADGEKLLAFFSKFVDAIVQNKENCGKMAAAVNGVVDTNADAVKLANEAKASGKLLPKALEEKMMARVKELMPAMQKCGSDKDVKAAVSRLEKKGDKAAEK